MNRFQVTIRLFVVLFSLSGQALAEKYENRFGIQLGSPSLLSAHNNIFGAHRGPFLLGQGQSRGGRAPEPEPPFYGILATPQEEPVEGWNQTVEFAMEFNEQLRWFAWREEPWNSFVRELEVKKLGTITAIYLSQSEMQKLVADYRKKNYNVKTKRELKAASLPKSPFSK